MFLLLPPFLVGAGGVLLFDGLLIYERFVGVEILGTTPPQPAVILLDQYQQIYGIDILNQDRFAVVELVGALLTVLFYVSHNYK